MHQTNEPPYEHQGKSPKTSIPIVTPSFLLMGDVLTHARSCPPAISYLIEFSGGRRWGCLPPRFLPPRFLPPRSLPRAPLCSTTETDQEGHKIFMKRGFISNHSCCQAMKHGLPSSSAVGPPLLRLGLA